MGAVAADSPCRLAAAPRLTTWIKRRLFQRTHARIILEQKVHPAAVDTAAIAVGNGVCMVRVARTNPPGFKRARVTRIANDILDLTNEQREHERRHMLLPLPSPLAGLRPQASPGCTPRHCRAL